MQVRNQRKVRAFEEIDFALSIRPINDLEGGRLSSIEKEALDERVLRGIVSGLGRVFGQKPIYRDRPLIIKNPRVGKEQAALDESSQSYDYAMEIGMLGEVLCLRYTGKSKPGSTKEYFNQFFTELVIHNSRKEERVEPIKKKETTRPPRSKSSIMSDIFTAYFMYSEKCMDEPNNPPKRR